MNRGDRCALVFRDRSSYDLVYDPVGEVLFSSCGRVYDLVGDGRFCSYARPSAYLGSNRDLLRLRSLVRSF